MAPSALRGGRKLLAAIFEHVRRRYHDSPGAFREDGKMRRQIAAALCTAALGVIALSSSSLAQQKKAKACAVEWQADKTANPRAHVAQCRASSGNAAGDRQVYSSVKDLMESIIDPSADTLWGAAGTVIDKQGTQDLSPKTPEEWLNVRRAAVRIIEGSNLLMMPGREAAPAGTKSEAPGVELEPAEITALIKKKRKSFDGFAKALQALGLAALRASEAKNVPLLEDIGGRMENVCESCHQTFWYPQEKQAATGN
jgi:hypothetical protein